MNYKLLVYSLLATLPAVAQVDSTQSGAMNTLFGRDTTYRSQNQQLKLNMDATYDRPFLSTGKLPVSVGGYLEANTQYMKTNGITEGLSFQMRRMTLFLAATINRRIKFLSEIEFEDGTKEINIEFAAMDIQFDQLLNLRGGIIMNPIGSFNQNHDGPKWEFVDRPLSSTRIIPSTWSNVGFGVYGKKYTRDWVWAYEAYLTNGFDDQIIANNQNRTFLPASKASPNRFEESFNGVPLVTLKTALKRRKVGEIGLSWMGGLYNKFQDDGLVLDERRRVDVWAVDFNTTLPSRTFITGEWVWAHINVPPTYTQQFGRKQQGGWVDVVHPILRGRLLGWNTASLNVALRVERVDYNVDTFKETGENIYDELWSVVPAISFRPSPTTVIRANYRYQWDTDLLGNSPVRTAGFQVGFSTYF
ncbi:MULTISPECIES: hypothetical protein [unclassified Spirosoma]|jgi:hypothetical protein|uniref:hypothetical protein n=1 Tax=unclassified Spirosoma TaxID=2621999 RepID=UPI000AD53AFF|nr:MULTISPECIES: hypothetical protein [unclassified Spirosoma]MBN8826894.1 hypothetical protein [Spirosoma sp.]